MSEIFDPTKVSTTRGFALQTIAYNDGNKGYMYVKADGAISVGAVCEVGLTGEADELDSATTNIYGSPLGVAQVAIPDNSYGWLQVYGPCDAIEVAASTTLGAKMYGSTVDGRIAVGVTEAEVFGILVKAKSAAGNTTGFLTFPTLNT